MKLSAWTVITGIASVLFLAAAIVAIALGPCSAMIDCNGTDTHMKCFWAYRAADVALVCSTVMGVIATTRKCKEARLASLVCTILCGAASVFLLTPAGIGTCGGAQMACNVHATIIYVLCACAIVLLIVAIFKADPAQASKPKMSL